MLRESIVHLKTPNSLEKIYFVLFDSQALSAFEKVWAEMAARGELGGASAAGR